MFDYTRRFCLLAVTSSLKCETIKVCYRIGAEVVDPRELPDLSGLDWREALSRCLESFIPWHAMIPPDRHIVAPVFTPGPESRPAEPALHTSPAEPTLHARSAEPKAVCVMPAAPVTVSVMPAELETDSVMPAELWFSFIPPSLKLPSPLVPSSSKPSSPLVLPSSTPSSPLVLPSSTPSSSLVLSRPAQSPHRWSRPAQSPHRWSRIVRLFYLQRS
ncbi:hypothetical protein PO909_016339 [Leuciscus waleckii]